VVSLSPLVTTAATTRSLAPNQLPTRSPNSGPSHAESPRPLAYCNLIGHQRRLLQRYGPFHCQVHWVDVGREGNSSPSAASTSTSTSTSTSSSSSLRIALSSLSQPTLVSSDHLDVATTGRARQLSLFVYIFHITIHADCSLSFPASIPPPTAGQIHEQKIAYFRLHSTSPPVNAHAHAHIERSLASSLDPRLHSFKNKAALKRPATPSTLELIPQRFARRKITSASIGVSPNPPISFASPLLQLNS
jgi:hypothetical protein